MVEYWINTISGLTVMSAMEREREREREKKKKQCPQENLELGLYFHSPSLQTVYDALHELCEMLGLQKEEDLEEFGLYVDPGKRVSRLQ